MAEIRLDIESNKKLNKFLAVLVETGIYGETREEVAYQLLRESMESFIVTGKIDKLKYYTENK